MPPGIKSSLNPVVTIEALIQSVPPESKSIDLELSFKTALEYSSE
jgi:hypothetical protein